MRNLKTWMIPCVALFMFQPAIAAEESTLQPFATDGCSLWIDGTVTQPNLWRHCCVAHDKAYWIGGTEQQRKDADSALMSCVAGVAGPGMGSYMHFFVAMGGSPYWVTPYRWGYGWYYLDGGRPRGYREPNEREQLQIQQLMPLAEKAIAEDALRHPEPKAPPVAADKSGEAQAASTTPDKPGKTPTITHDYE